MWALSVLSWLPGEPAQAPTPCGLDTSELCSKSPTSCKPSDAAVQRPHCARRRRTPGSIPGPCCGDRSGGRRGRECWRVRLGRAGYQCPLPSVYPGIDPHTLQLVGGTRAGQPDLKARRVCQELSRGLKSPTSTRTHFPREVVGGGQGDFCCWGDGKQVGWEPCLSLNPGSAF